MFLLWTMGSQGQKGPQPDLVLPWGLTQRKIWKPEKVKGHTKKAPLNPV